METPAKEPVSAGPASTSPSGEFPLVRVVAPIKDEFLVKKHQPTAATDAKSGDAENGGSSAVPVKRKADDVTVEGESSAGDAQKRTKTDYGTNQASASNGIVEGPDRANQRKDRRGQNKGFQRKQNKATPRGNEDSDRKYCNHVLVGRPCFRMIKTGNCSFSHDVEEYLKVKEPDLGNFCPFWEKYGACTYGFKCRFASGHKGGTHASEPSNQTAQTDAVGADKAGDKPKETGDDQLEGADASSSIQTDILNTKGIDLLRSMRKGDFKLNRSLTILNWLENERKAREARSAQGFDYDRPITSTLDVAPPQKRPVSFRHKTYLAPLTTVGNLPFRRICVNYGCDVTCSEMAMCSRLLAGDAPEWSLVKRWEGEKCFGVQLAGKSPEQFAKTIELLTNPERGIAVDFFDINCGCPTDDIFSMGCGSALMGRTSKLQDIVRAANFVSNRPINVKIRMGIEDHKPIATKLIPKLYESGASLVTLHGRSRHQRYTREADWNYIAQCGKEKREREAALRRELEAKLNRAEGDPVDDEYYPDLDPNVPRRAPTEFFGNGDVMHYQTYLHVLDNLPVDGMMIGRGALIKPWIFTEIKERRVWDISSRERFDMMQDFARFGVENWGSDNRGLAQTRRFLLEWCAFLHRYVPVGVLDRYPESGEPMLAHINARPKAFVGRDDLETLMASPFVGDWMKLTERIPLIGKAPEGFTFIPKHKANAWKDTSSALDQGADDQAEG